MSQPLLTQVKELCRLYDIKPSRSKVQNFLVNPAVLDDIISAAQLSLADTVLEVGPGLGVLTERLVEQAGHVVSVELDDKLYRFLQTKFIDVHNLEIIHDDILTARGLSYQTTPYKVVANLPYNITSHFLKKFLTTEHKPTAMTLLLQREVAKRITAPAGAMSLLSVSVQLYGEPEVIVDVPRENFWPSPDVDSAVVHIKNIKTATAVDNLLGGISEKHFWKIVRIGFSARRKQLKNNLASGLGVTAESIEKTLKNMGFDPKIRAQELTVTDWVTIAQHLGDVINK